MIKAFFGKIPDRVEKAVNIVKGNKKTEGPEINPSTPQNKC